MALPAGTAITTLLAMLPAGPALAAPPITCGMSVTTNITLTRDLTCPGSGLHIRASRVTVDLGGHTLAGSGSGTGITVDSESDLRIMGGTITGFHQAVSLRGVWNVALQRLRLVGNRPTDGAATLEIFDSRNLEFLDSQILQPTGTALFAEDSTHIRMERLRGSGRFTLWGSGASLAYSTITDGQLQFLSHSGGSIQHNQLRRSSIEASQSPLTIAENHFTGPVSTAIETSRGTPFIDRNVISGARRGLVLSVSPLWSAYITQNVLRDNDYGIVLVEPDLRPTHLMVNDNSFVGNRQAGFFIEAERVLDSVMSVSRNTFIRNGHGSTDHDAAGRRINDGIHTNLPISETRLTVSHNRTYFNADRGVEALPAGSVIDGGGNQSTGDPNGCAGVTCT